MLSALWQIYMLLKEVPLSNKVIIIIVVVVGVVVIAVRVCWWLKTTVETRRVVMTMCHGNAAL